jgi:predicted transcriptional regulator
MKLHKKIALFVSLFVGIYPICHATPKIGDRLEFVEIGGENGGRTNGEKWSSDTIKDRLWLLFYVDPDHKDDNIELEKSLKKENFSEEHLGSIGVINMAATWLPDVALKPALDAKQKDYPKVVYVLDRKKTLLEKWKLNDDDYNVLLFGKDGILLHINHGTLDTKAIGELISTIRKNLPNTPASQPTP